MARSTGTEIKATVIAFKRIANSTKGHARYTITTDRGTYNTGATSVWVLEQSVAHMLDQEWILTIDGRGTIIDARKA